VRLAQGDLAGAVRWVHTSGLRTDNELNYPQEEEYLTLARILIAQGQEDPSEGPLDDALGILVRLLEAAENKGRMGSVIEILVLRALALQKRGDRSEARGARPTVSRWSLCYMNSSKRGARDPVRHTTALCSITHDGC
jgi:hypothetical protein